VANVVTPLFGGIPATGAIARTATNIRNGASTPVAGIVHALTLFAIMLLFGRWASLVPMCSLAAVLVVVAYNMSEWRAFRALLRTPRGDVAVLLCTFALTVIFDLTLAVQIGVVMAAFLFMKRMADVTHIDAITRELSDLRSETKVEEDDELAAAAKRVVPAGVQVYEVNGPFFFGAADKLRDVLNIVDKTPRVLILRMRHVPFIDATGLHILEQVHQNCTKTSTTLMLSGVRHQPLNALRKGEYLEAIGKENVIWDIDQALERAREIISTPRAAGSPLSSKPRKKRRGKAA
jgi:SulP family sulfate permease